MTPGIRKTVVTRILRIVAYYIVSTVALLGILELVVRIAYPEIKSTSTSRDLVMDSVYGQSAGLRPFARGLSGEKMFSVDALGFWKYAANADSLQNGWLLLGDSVTMGIGVSPDSTFAGRLAGLCPAWYILNPSWLGYSSADYVNIAKHMLIKRRFSDSSIPQIKRLTIFWTLNDVYSDGNIGMPPGQAVRDIGSAMLGWMRRHLRAYHWLKHLWSDRPKAHFDFDAQFYRHDDPRYVEASQDLLEIKTMCSDAGVRLEVVLLPYEYQLRQHDSPTSRPQTLFSRMLDRQNIRWYDLTALFQALPGDHRELYLFGDGIHFSNSGHTEISRFIREVSCGRFN